MCLCIHDMCLFIKLFKVILGLNGILKQLEMALRLFHKAYQIVIINVENTKA